MSLLLKNPLSRQTLHAKEHPDRCLSILKASAPFPGRSGQSGDQFQIKVSANTFAVERKPLRGPTFTIEGTVVQAHGGSQVDLTLNVDKTFEPLLSLFLIFPLGFGLITIICGWPAVGIVILAGFAAVMCAAVLILNIHRGKKEFKYVRQLLQQLLSADEGPLPT